MPLVQQGECDAGVAVYVNRLSDYLFTAARWAGHQAGEEEVPYKKATGKRGKADDEG